MNFQKRLGVSLDDLEELFISLKEAGVRPDIITFLRHELKRVKQEKKESYQSRKEKLCATS